MELSAALVESGSPLLAAVALASAAASGLATWLIGARNISSALERTRLKAGAELSATEANERASFRASLLAELSALRALVRDCENDRDRLRDRLNAAEGQILILKASNEILEKWINFLRARAGEVTTRGTPFTMHIDVPSAGD